jgi:hypothetical protein
MAPLFTLLCIVSLPQLIAFSFNINIARPACPTSRVLRLSSEDDIDALLADDDNEPENVVKNSLMKENLPFQTDGGVIMPEGGANPCVIKVSWYLIALVVPLCQTCPN